MKLKRQIKYYYLRFIRLRGQPHELALGMACGVLTGMMPIMPFQIALAVTLAIFLKGSKITAALGTWVSNPLNWYFIYYYSYKIGVSLLGLKERKAVFAAIMTAIHSGEASMAVVGKILEAGFGFVAAFLLGGLIMGTLAAIPSYFIFLYLFRSLQNWRRSKKRDRIWTVQDH